MYLIQCIAQGFAGISILRHAALAGFHLAGSEFIQPAAGFQSPSCDFFHPGNLAWQNNRNTHMKPSLLGYLSAAAHKKSAEDL